MGAEQQGDSRADAAARMAGQYRAAPVTLTVGVATLMAEYRKVCTNQQIRHSSCYVTPFKHVRQSCNKESVVYLWCVGGPLWPVHRCGWRASVLQ